MSLNRDRGRGSAQSIVSFLYVLVGSSTRRVLVKLGVLLYEADDALLVNGRLSADPLRLSHAVLNVIEAWGGSVNLWDFV